METRVSFREGKSKHIFLKDTFFLKPNFRSKELAQKKHTLHQTKFLDQIHAPLGICC